jgi:dolichol-phosphate mannosyltransferase
LVHDDPALEPPRVRQGEGFLLSVVVPCYDEEPVVRETHARLVAALEGIAGAGFEIVYVDDGSSDGTLSMLRALQKTDPRVRVIALSRNFGQQIAVAAGLEHAAGDAVVLIDADLQDPPEVIPAMVERWRAGVDVAYGARAGREGESPLKLWTAKTFGRTLNRLADVDIPLDAGDFRLMDRRVVDALLAMRERDRFVRGMVAWIGFRQEPVHYGRAARFAGRTKYSLARMIRLASDGILSFTMAPLRLAFYAGLAAAGLALAGTLYAVAHYLSTGVGVAGWVVLLIAVLLLGGVQLVVLGVLGEYLGRVYGEAKQRPLYLVKERLGFIDPDRGSTGRL